jgi:alpha-glucosidase
MASPTAVPASRSGTPAPSPTAVASPTAVPFYARVIYVAGFPVKGSAKVTPEALTAAADAFGLLVFGNAAVVNRMRNAGVEVAVIAESESLTDLPEYVRLRGGTMPDGRSYEQLRALGPSPCVAGEENLLGHAGDIYAGANILIHECAHAVYVYGLDVPQRARWNDIYTKSMAAGRWSGTYAAVNASEFFAELTESYFGVNAPPEPGVHNDVNGAARLAAYEPSAFAFLVAVYTPVGSP